jgi:putative colanic acid biosynthesis acetyltransferase WcaF
MYLDQYNKDSFTLGAPYWKVFLWYAIGSPLIQNYLLDGLKTGRNLKVLVLRWFGASVGQGVLIRPGVKIKLPWRLHIGNHVWIGQDAWLDNAAEIYIEDHVCISQGAYLCTGNHDWSDPTFRLKLGAIRIECSSWIGAKAVVGPGITIGRGAVLSLGSVTGKSLQPMTIYAGNPAIPIKQRSLTKI